MSDERHERDPDAEVTGGSQDADGAEVPQGAGDEEGGAQGPPPPVTWAGRRKAQGDEVDAIDEGTAPDSAGPEEGDPPSGGAEEDLDEPAAGDERVGAGEGLGLTEEFHALDQELAAQIEPLLKEEGRSAADEQEVPPDEFAFEEEEEAGEHAGPADPEELAAQETIEADTLALADAEERREAEEAALAEAGGEGEPAGGEEEPEADEEAAREAAHAALAARAAERGGALGVVQLAPVGEPPKRRLWLRFLAGSLVVVAAMAVATSVSLLVYLADIAEGLRDDPELGNVRLPDAGGGEPQTILILGSDKRGEPGDPGRSDTTMLVRIDPAADAIRVLSLPRDLKVQIPTKQGVSVTDKLNAAYSYGGPTLTLRTVQELMPQIDINHIVNVDFKGFYDAINAIGCVYVDIDRHYYNPVGGEYDDIDIKPGYTKLCGYRALDYVRYRHNDNDLVRAARQQNFLREARQRISPSKLVSDRKEMIKIFTKYTSSDIDDEITLLEIIKTLVGARNATVRQIPFQSSFVGNYVVASKAQLRSMAREFMGLAGDDDKAKQQGDQGGEKKKAGKRKQKRKKEKKPEKSPEPPMQDASGLALPYAEQFRRYMRHRDVDLPIYYPTKMVPGSGITPESRAYGVADFNDEKIFRGYKFVMPYQEAGFTSYYGVSGINWVDPPILRNPSERRRIHGREYLLFYDGDRLRLVGWKTKRGSYWVINTLTHALSEEQMLAIATSTEKLD